jgi:hypothetical protein
VWLASVETNLGEKLNLLRSDGFIGGKALLAFLTPLDNYCATHKAEPEDDPLRNWFDWFSQLDSQAAPSLAEATQALRQAYYVGEWNYLESDYELYRSRAPNLPLSAAEFISIIEALEAKWTDIKSVLESVETLLQLLMRRNPEPVDGLYNPSDTLPDLQGLRDVLDIFVKRKAEKVRVQIL